MEENPKKKKDKEEKGLSFSISRILQNHEESKAVTIECDEKTNSKHTIGYQCCETNDDVLKFTVERVSEPLTMHPWQILTKQTNRRIGHPYQSRAAPKRKKPRTTFSRAQIAELEELFTEKKYLTSSERQKVASYLNLSDCQQTTLEEASKKFVHIRVFASFTFASSRSQYASCNGDLGSSSNLLCPNSPFSRL
eukprot:gene3018-1282_t